VSDAVRSLVRVSAHELHAQKKVSVILNYSPALGREFPVRSNGEALEQGTVVWFDVIVSAKSVLTTEISKGFCGRILTNKGNHDCNMFSVVGTIGLRHFVPPGFAFRFLLQEQGLTGASAAAMEAESGW
jgi:hypothetical protein